LVIFNTEFSELKDSLLALYKDLDKEQRGAKSIKLFVGLLPLERL
jgi:hypothetical protein